MIYDHVSGSLSDLDLEMVRAVPPGGNWRDLPEETKSSRVQQIRASAARGEGSRSTYYGRLRWDRPSYTVSTYFNRPGNGCFIHPSADRLITVREAARLQSFPDSYRLLGRGRARYLQVGNAVPPLLAYQLGSLLGGGTAVDLFAGAGGLSLGLERAGFDVLAAIDHDAACMETYQANRPDEDAAIRADLSDTQDLRKVVDEIRRRNRGQAVDLLAGGPPCQGFSTAGHCRLDDFRNNLVYSFVKAVEELRPVQVLMENVAALTFRGRRSFLEEVQRSFQSMGYNTSFIVGHAEGYGVPQLRRRLFLVATRNGAPSWPTPFRRILDPMMGQYQPGAEVRDLPEPFTVRDAIGDLPFEAAESADDPVKYREVAGSLYQECMRGDLSPDAICPAPVPAHEERLLFDPGEIA
jgi:DNA (cytosine-5)-methyltransferase 1